MPYKTRKVGDKYCVYKKDSGKKVGCTKGTEKAKKKYLAALHIAEDEVEVKMESFKLFFENKDADIEDLKKMIIAATKTISDPRFKEYGGRDNYIKMLKKKLARLEADIEYLNPEEIKKFAYNLGYENIESSDMPMWFDYNGKRYYIKDEGDNWEVWANAWNEGNKDMRSDDYSNRADYYRELEIYGEDEQSKIRKGGAGKAFYTGTRVEKDKKKEQSKKQARGKVSSEDAEENEIIYVGKKNLIYPYNNYGYNYKGYQLEVKEEVEPGERNFYFFDVYDPKGNKIDTPKGFKLIDIYGELNEQNFKSYIDSLTNSEDAEDRCKRKADSVYGKKTSAYKSGAIVRCRKGKIWKKK